MGSKKHYDVVIIGGGPGGIAAAIWSGDLGLSTALVDENTEFGGQLLRVHNPIWNYPGRSATDGPELRDHLLESLDRFPCISILDRKVVSADVENKRVRLADGEELECSVIILATGVRRRRLGVPGEAEFSGRGIMQSGVNEKESCAGKTVLIVGGGDAALENASLLSKYAASVFVIHRRSQFSARKEFIDSATADPKVQFKFDTIVKSFSGNQAIESVEIENVRSGKIERLAVDAVLIRAGVEPNTELFVDKSGIDDKGYLIVDRFCRTSIDGIFAVGDVANPVSPTIATATGMGATAAKSAYDLISGKQGL